MRDDLISRKEAIKTILSESEGEACDMWDKGFNRGMRSAAYVVKGLPAIDAVYVVHARNVAATHPSDMFVCGNCGFNCDISELVYEDEDDSGMGVPTAHEYECKFCPDCGSKIDLMEDAPCE